MSDLDRGAVEAFRRQMAGSVLVPEDEDYEAARTIFNAMIDRRPAVIAQCASPGDVAAAIAFARMHGLELAVRGGGHGVAGRCVCDGGLVLDLRRMNSVTVDPKRRIAKVAGGAIMRELDRATYAHGLATTGGRVSTTGVGGFTLGGGSGWLDRKFGLACDNLVSVELITAEGILVVASETENPDLFWALHGGGGNFGVATSFVFRLHPLPGVTAALMSWRRERAVEVLKTYRDFMEEAPDEVGGGALFVTGPEIAAVPPELVGKLTLLVLVVYAGHEAEARRLIAPLLAMKPDGQAIAEMAYPDLQCMLDEPPGMRNYWSVEYLRAFPDEAVERFVARAEHMLVPSSSQHVLFPGGGQVARETADWPIPWRRAPWCVHPFGLWSDPKDDEHGIRWAHELRRALQPWATGDVYLNFIGDEGRDRVIAGLGRENYRKLAEVKARWDPTNFFHLNHNIEPAHAMSA